jgi:hypothetical protein
MGFLTWLASLITGPLLQAGVDAYKVKLASGNTSERIAADVAERELSVEQRERELATQLLIAERGNWITRWVRPLWALPFVLFTWKVIVWDMILGLGSTPELRGWNATLGVTVATAYFGGRTIESVARILKRK